MALSMQVCQMDTQPFISVMASLLVLLLALMIFSAIVGPNETIHVRIFLCDVIATSGKLLLS